MKIGSLFSGAGLGDFGFYLAGMEIAWQVEIDKYCRQVLDLRWPDVPKHKDIKTFNGREHEKPDIITGGFPCQPFSVAGKQDGADDDRNLWPQMFRVIREVRPRWIVAENVPGIVNLYLDTVLADLESAGYTCWPFVFSAHSLGAWHRRDRLWIVAYAEREPGIGGYDREILLQNIGGIRKGWKKKIRDEDRVFPKMGKTGNSVSSQWKSMPEVCGMDDGCPDILDRLKALGNGQCPANTFLIGRKIIEYEEMINVKKTNNQTSM